MRRRRGFALLIAVTLLGLAGATLAILATLVAGEARRTREAAAEAQVRQLLIAGEALAQAQMQNAATTQPVEVKLPDELKGATVVVQRTGEQAHIEVAFEGRRAGETVWFSKNGNGWQVSGVELDSR